MSDWLATRACASRSFCRACRLNPANYRAPEACPHGVTLDAIPAPRVGGPGTELKRILSSFGIAPGNCACNVMAAKMDAWGVEGCEARLEEIVDHLAKAAAQHGWLRFAPFKAAGARLLARQAIDAARVG